MEIWRLKKTARQLRYREVAGIARFQEAKSGNFLEDADSERKASQETSWRTLNRREKPFRRLSGGRPMKDENGDMAPDEDREAVENRETADIERQQKSRDSDE